MRRLKDTLGAPGHLELVKLTRSQILFVQRWMELFDWGADIQFQHRPVSLAEAKAEKREAEKRGPTNFHVPLLTAEVAELQAAPRFSRRLVATNPILAAERLAAKPAAKLHHPQYLFHAIKTLLDATSPSFEDRLGKLKQDWATSTDIDYVVYFRVTKLMALPAKRKKSCFQLLPKDGLPENVLPESVRLAANKWFEAPEIGSAARVPPVVKVTATARDPNGAMERAIRTYYDYRACVRVASPSLKPTEIDLSDAVLETPGKAAPPRFLPIQRRRFEMRGGKDLALLERVDAAASASGLVATFVRNLAEAIERLREGDLDSALEALILNQDLAFYGCKMHTWGYPRYLVEIGSKLVALDWPRRYFEYIEGYIRQTSYTVEPLPGMRDRKQSRVLLLAPDAWPRVTDDRRWEKIISRAKWDSLLAYRREDFVRSLFDLPATLRRVQTVAAWDLARAVRARNTLVHQGGYLQHHRLIGVLLDTYELVLRLRLMASERRPKKPQAGFVELVKDIERDFDKAIRGNFTRQTPRSLCQDGWSAMWVAPAPAADA